MLAAEKIITTPSATVTPVAVLVPVSQGTRLTISSIGTTPVGPSTSVDPASGTISLTTTAMAMAMEGVTSTTSRGTNKFEMNWWWSAILPLTIVGLFLI